MGIKIDTQVNAMGFCFFWCFFLFCFVFLPDLVLFDTGFPWCSLVECFVFFQRKERLLPVETQLHSWSFPHK